MNRHNSIKFSIIIPLYNEEESVDLLHKELITSLDGYEYELVYVNDGSTDSTYDIIKKNIENLKPPYAKIVNFAKNFGQSSAFKIGLANARFSCLIFMDGDLQNDPADIPLLLEKFQEGYDLVQGVRLNRNDPFLYKILPSKLANLILRFLCKSKYKDLGCSLKIFSKKFSEGLYFYQGFHRVLPIYFSLKGAKTTEVKVKHRKRLFGRSKYGLSRAGEVLFEIIKINFFEKKSDNIIYITASIAFILFILSFLISCNIIKNINTGPVTALLYFILGLYLFITAAILYMVRSFYIRHQKNKYLDKFTPEIIIYEQ